MSTFDSKGWRLVTDFDVMLYECGLSAGDTMRLKRDLVCRLADGTPTGEVIGTDEVWQVLNGSSDSPGVVFLKQANGKLHTWDDNPSIFDDFEVVSRGQLLDG